MMKKINFKNDSRLIIRGDDFIAIPCPNVTSHIEEAIQKGALRIFGRKEDLPKELPRGVEKIIKSNPRVYDAKRSKEIYPKQPSHVFAVTGTNGKTSSVFFIRELLEKSGFKAASLGTIGLGLPYDMVLDIDIPSLTTPSPLVLHKCFDELFHHGVDSIAFEASSHGLHQYRLDGINVNVAVFTNITQDHMDYHKNMEDYFQAKARLFTELLEQKGTAVIQMTTCDYASRLVTACKERGIKTITVGKQDVDLTWKILSRLGREMQVQFCYEGQQATINVPLVGDFQIENLSGAIASCLSIGLPFEKLMTFASSISSVRGRMEYAGNYQGADIFVDYAHTPDALEKALTTLRHHTKNRLHVVFGCGGNRDPLKRPIMGEIACQLANDVYITDDNPRFEDADLIRQQIMEKAIGAKEISGRGMAIKEALLGLKEGDTCLIAGKGHEQGQMINGVNYPFDDVQMVKKYITAQSMK